MMAIAPRPEGGPTCGAGERTEGTMATETSLRTKQGRRAALLAAAREVLAEKGLDAAKVSEIVARAGVAQGTFYLYFPSKLSLVIALAEDLDRQILSATQAAVARAKTLSE